ncbi:hypothetical protein [Tenacibaculum jejuense]|uniref:Anti-sigma factor n=1 Tax=Tenacibaculum jejuense TaxID=584609 RepID=A0A238U9Z1_9FLAO|nr:hypothetical protein [Tenacibaculum jejuense]SNR16017.1 conserved protein of unknown function [Tenacibaculum jejuense]
MKDQFEDFFINNDFDINEPHSGHEDRFLRKLNRQQEHKKKLSWTWMGAAASILIVLSFFLGKYSLEENSIQTMFPEMAETETFFVNTIAQELKEIEKFRNIETESIIEDALDQIEELEDQFKNFKKDLSVIGNERQIIKGMIDNYQQRLQILEQLLFQLEYIKNPTQQNNDNNEFI